MPRTKRVHSARDGEKSKKARVEEPAKHQAPSRKRKTKPPKPTYIYVVRGHSEWTKFPEAGFRVSTGEVIGYYAALRDANWKTESVAWDRFGDNAQRIEGMNGVVHWTCGKEEEYDGEDHRSEPSEEDDEDPDVVVERVVLEPKGTLIRADSIEESEDATDGDSGSEDEDDEDDYWPTLNAEGG